MSDREVGPDNNMPNRNHSRILGMPQDAASLAKPLSRVEERLGSLGCIKAGEEHFEMSWLASKKSPSEALEVRNKPDESWQQKLCAIPAEGSPGLLATDLTGIPAQNQAIQKPEGSKLLGAVGTDQSGTISLDALTGMYPRKPATRREPVLATLGVIGTEKFSRQITGLDGVTGVNLFGSVGTETPKPNVCDAMRDLASGMHDKNSPA